MSNIFSFKKGSVAREERWEAITEKLNQVKTPSFHLKEKRAVRDRWLLFQKKFNAKMHTEEEASGISVEEMSVMDVLLEELVEKEESMSKAEEAQSKQQKEEKTKAEDIRQKASVRYSEKKKRNNGDDCEEKPKHREVHAQNHWLNSCKKKPRMSENYTNSS